jgi:hypothetical protein
MIETVKRPTNGEVTTRRPIRASHLRPDVELAERFRGMRASSLRRRLGRDLRRTEPDD